MNNNEESTEKSQQFFFLIIYFKWRLITSQYCGGFCHTSTWISQGCTCVPPSWTLLHLPPHTIPLSCPRASALGTLFHAAILISSIQRIEFEKYLFLLKFNVYQHYRTTTIVEMFLNDFSFNQLTWSSIFCFFFKVY